MPQHLDRAISERLLKWRKRQKPSRIMRPSTFQEIKEEAAKAGARDPEAVAGAAYWAAAEKKFRERKKK